MCTRWTKKATAAAATHSFCSFRCCFGFGFGFCSCFRSCSFPSLSVCVWVRVCVLKHENVCSSSTWANKRSIYFFILLCWWCWVCVLVVLLFSLQFIRMLHFASLCHCAECVFVCVRLCWRDYFVVASVDVTVFAQVFSFFFFFERIRCIHSEKRRNITADDRAQLKCLHSFVVKIT